MADSLYYGELGLPPRFLSDDDLRLASTLKKRDVFGFQADDAFHRMGFFSFDSPLSGLGSVGGSSDLSSPSDSDNEDFMTGLTSQFARSTVTDCFGNTEAGSLAALPQSTLRTGGSCCKSQQRSNGGIPNGPGQLSLAPPPASWDMFHAAAARVTPHHRKPSYMAAAGPHAGFYPHPQQETLTGQNRNRARNCDFIGALPPKSKCAGTGVFLPRPKLTASQTRKKPGCSVLLPARVVQALNLNLDPCRSVAENGGLGSGLLEHPQGRRLRPRQDIRLPQEWTY